MNFPNKVTLVECVDSLLIRSGDMQGIKRAQYLSVARDIYNELNLEGIKDSKRIKLKVNKDFNSITLPDGSICFSTVYGMVEGRLVAFLANPNLSEDIIDLSRDKKCEHESCSSSLCATVKNYELIEESVQAMMPDGTYQSFNKVSRKKINQDGSYILEVIEPVAVYTGGIHSSTILQTKSNLICSLEVNEDGCVKDCRENREKVYANCAFQDIYHDAGKPSSPLECCHQNLTYGVSDDGLRIIFPSNLSVTDVIVRVYYDLKTKDITVPIVCKKMVMLKIKEAIADFDDKMSAGRLILLKRDIFAEKQVMMGHLTRMTISELYQTISPKRVIRNAAIRRQ